MLWMVGPTFNLAIVSMQNTIGFTVYYKIYTGNVNYDQV